MRHQSEFENQQDTEERELEERMRRRRRSTHVRWRRWIIVAICLWVGAFVLGVYHDLRIWNFQPYPWQLMIGIGALGVTIFAFMEAQLEGIDDAIAAVKHSIKKNTEQNTQTVATLATSQTESTEALAKLTETVSALKEKVERLEKESTYEERVKAYEIEDTDVPNLEDRRRPDPMP